MPDAEKVINGLEKTNDIIEKWIPMFEQYNTPATINDAITLLKEQRPKESRWISIPYKKDRICKRCGHDEPYKFAEKEREIYLYCPHCGAKMVNETD